MSRGGGGVEEEGNKISIGSGHGSEDAPSERRHAAVRESDRDWLGTVRRTHTPAAWLDRALARSLSAAAACCFLFVRWALCAWLALPLACVAGLATTLLRERLAGRWVTWAQQFRGPRVPTERERERCQFVCCEKTWREVCEGSCCF